MKKAYNVCKLYEEAKSSLKVLSVLMVFFLGFTSQTTAQAAIFATPNGVVTPDNKETIKEIHTEYDFNSVAVEEFVQTIKDFGNTVMAVEQNDPVREVEQVFTMDFLRNISRNIESAQDVPTSVQNAYVRSLNSSLVSRHQNSGIDFEGILEDVLRDID